MRLSNREIENALEFERQVNEVKISELLDWYDEWYIPGRPIDVFIDHYDYDHWS